MDSLLVIGVHTRPAVFSAKNLGYKVYSVDYFGDMDLKERADVSKSIIDQRPYCSLGRLSEDYSDEKLIRLSKGLDSDGIILTSTLNLNERRIFGTKPSRTKKIKDKEYQLKKVKKLGIAVPRSEVVNSKAEVAEIAEDTGFPFVLKPVRGNGGKKVCLVRDFSDIPEIDERCLLQEYVRGKTISVSTLSTRRESVAISTSEQILGLELLNCEGFTYCGSIVPYTSEEELLLTAEKISKAFNVIGWNGIDFVEGRELTFMEINPRFQGTFDCVERVYGINLIDAHIKACQGELIPIPEAKGFSVRMTLYAKERSMIIKDLKGHTLDVPCKYGIVEKGEPITTVVASSLKKGNAIRLAERKVKEIYANFIEKI